MRVAPIHWSIWTCHRSNYLWQDAMHVWRYEEWAANLRMSRATLMFVVEQLTLTLAKETTKFRAKIPVSKQEMIAVYKLATTCEFRTMSNLVGVGCSTVVYCFNQRSPPQYIVFPVGTQLQRMIDGFMNRWDYPQYVSERCFVFPLPDDLYHSRRVTYDPFEFQGNM